jgi:general nucleoside transport system permease protein
MSASTATAPAEELQAHDNVVEVPISSRRRLLTGLGLTLAGLVIFFGWGVSARNGEAAFQISQFFDRWHVPDLRYPGGGAAMVMGIVVLVIGLLRLVPDRPADSTASGAVRALVRIARFTDATRIRRRWSLVITLLLFVLAFLSWAATGAPGQPLNPISLTGVVQNTITSSIPYILGALAGVVCERSGVINVAIEGQMLVGAFAGALVSSWAHNLGWGLFASLLGGALIGILLAVFAIRYLVNQVVLGVVLNTLALGLTNLGFHSIMAGETNSAKFNAGGVLNPIKIPLLGDIPIIGQALFNVNIIVYITYGLVVVVQLWLFGTRWGLRTRAVGEHPRAADTVGIKVNRMRYRNVIIGGLIAGLAGATLTIGGSGQFNSNISSGKGFIALAAVIFGRWSPGGAVAAALLFGFFDQVQVTLGIVGTPVGIPAAFLTMVPYVVTVIAVAGLVGRVQAPAADGEPYTKS